MSTLVPGLCPQEAPSVSVGPSDGGLHVGVGQGHPSITPMEAVKVGFGGRPWGVWRRPTPPTDTVPSWHSGFLTLLEPGSLSCGALGSWALAGTLSHPSCPSLGLPQVHHSGLFTKPCSLTTPAGTHPQPKI